LSYDKLGSSARTLLHICSLLHHEGIREEMFEKASLSQIQLDDSNLQIQVTDSLIQIGKQNSTWNSLLFQRVMGEIMSYSLVEFDSQNQWYSIHTLVQHWSASMIGQDQHNKQKGVLSIIGLSILRRFNSDDYKYRKRLLQHIITLKGAFKAEEKVI